MFLDETVPHAEFCGQRPSYGTPFFVSLHGLIIRNGRVVLGLRAILSVRGLLRDGLTILICQ